MGTALHQLPAHAARSHARIHVVVETPKGSRNKVAFDPDLEVFMLKGVLPEGHSFLYDFGFVPSPKAEDGDPLDVLLLLDAPAFAGGVVEARLLGALEMEQREADGTVQRNDRLLAVAANSREHKSLHTLTDLSADICTRLSISSTLIMRQREAKSRCFGAWGPSVHTSCWPRLSNPATLS